MSVFVACAAGLDADGDGDKKHQSAVLTELPEPSAAVPGSEQADMNPLALDHSDYESMHETTQTGKGELRCAWTWLNNKRNVYFELNSEHLNNTSFVVQYMHSLNRP